MLGCTSLYLLAQVLITSSYITNPYQKKYEHCVKTMDEYSMLIEKAVQQSNTNSYQFFKDREGLFK